MKILKKNLISSLLYSLKSIILITILASLALILTAAYSPQSIQTNVKKSALILINEGEVPCFSKKIPGAKQDNFTTSIMLNNASFPTKENIIYNAFATPRADYGRKNQPANLFFAVTNQNLDQTQIVEYPRYWHGYLVILKPLLTFFDINQIRLLNFLTQTLLLIIVCYLTAKRLNKKYLLAFITAVFFLNPISLSKTLHYTIPYDIMLITIITILKKNTPPTYKTFLLTGISTAFFDFLSAPLLTLGFPLIFVINLYHTNLKSGLNRIILFSTAWTTGYLGFWFSKWILSSLILQKNIIKDAIDSIIYRTIGNGFNETGISDYTALNAYSRNLAELKPELFIVIILLFSIIILLSCLITKSTFIKNTQTLLTLLIGTYPFLWYAVVINHSVIHPLMSYRLLAITVFALTAALISAIKSASTLNIPHNS